MGICTRRREGKIGGGGSLSLTDSIMIHPAEEDNLSGLPNSVPEVGPQIVPDSPFSVGSREGGEREGGRKGGGKRSGDSPQLFCNQVAIFPRFFLRCLVWEKTV